MCRLGKAKVLSIFLCPALPNRPHQTVVVVKSGQDGLSQTLYLQKWPKSAFEIVVSKRCMLTFLEVNGIHMECTNEEVVEAGLSVASGTMDYDALLQWVRDHRI